MPRKPKNPEPWQRKDRKNDWYVTLRVGTKQKQEYLAPADADEQTVKNALLKVLLQYSVEDNRDQGPALPLLERFLDWCHKNQAPSTYKVRLCNLQSFINHLKKTGQLQLPFAELKPYHVTQWLDGNPRWGPSTRHLAMASLSAALNWCVEEGYAEQNPLARKLKRPAVRSRGREVYMSEGVYKEWLGFCRTPQHKHVLMAMWHTGCRPGEIVSLGKDPETGFDEQEGTWMVRGKRTKRNPTGLRVVALSPLMVQLSKKLRQQYPTGALFRNGADQPWCLDTLGHLFGRLRKFSTKMHPERAHEFKKLMPYSCRHSWATNRLREGHSPTHVSRLMGNSPTIMHRTYDHVLPEEVKDVVKDIKTVDGETL